ncbi:helix-turn-helix transcriptional regulator [Streptomyces sp. NBC_00557]|uniref:helix-turn-helix transcriptional regulator n=1 Tax=Streptomyces sp. NBC_00557 TaxID=2975776 RepID=UPI002E8207F0|nr:helix-turn-helix transcriptional regulator [Streptomyces sp. NBC_00557]WUC36536.1 helix-turn-helix transcriptional regulator [Streptomyces sp. NBC_00557]
MANALQQLIRERLDRQGWSYGDVARRGGVPRSTVHHLATADRVVRMPQATTLEGLARGLELPLDTVRRAAAEACGIHVYGGPSDEDQAAAAARSNDPEVELLIASVQQLSAEDRRHVAALVESLLGRSARPAPEK